MSDLLDDIKGGKIAPVYFLCGEPYLRDKAVLAIRKAVLKGDASAFNYDGFEASESDATQILAAARTVPMLGGKRLVLVKGADELDAEKLAKFIPYVEDPAPYTCLLMVGNKADLRLKFFSALKKTGVVKKFESLKEHLVPAWVASEARSQKIKLGPGAAERIADAIGTDMEQLASALERLSLYVGKEKQITASDVEDMLVQTRLRSIFELANAVGKMQKREALLVLNQMLQVREPAVRIVAMLARHLRHLWTAKEMVEAGKSKSDIASHLGIHPFFVSDIIDQAMTFDVKTLEKTHRALFEADRALKSSRLSDAVVLNKVVLSLCR